MTRARDVAADVLVRVDKERAFAAAALEAELSRAVQLEARDRALVTELVYGTLRVTPWLGQRIAGYAPRGTESLDPRVRACLLLAAYQLFFTRVPAFAAVNEAVDAVRAARGARMAAFANAVLRKVATEASRTSDADRDAALVASAPAWLHQALERAISADGARAFLRSALESPAGALRVERALGRDDERSAWIDRLREGAPHARFELGQASPLAILVRGAGKLQRLPGYAEGAWSVQEEGSQVAALAVDARPGQTVLDACAGRGNKTAVLARAVRGEGAGGEGNDDPDAGGVGGVDACDVSPAKLQRLDEELARLGLHARARLGVDWTAGSGEVTGVYDRVLVDAPCSGVGTLRRRPEIALRREEADLDAMARAQLAIASRAAEHVRPGGSLVYVVCSVLREEAEDVVAALLDARPELRPAPFTAPSARAVAGDAPFFRLLPHVHGTDGYFVAHFTNVARPAS